MIDYEHPMKWFVVVMMMLWPRVRCHPQTNVVVLVATLAR
jgi:hypothetical protein